MSSATSGNISWNSSDTRKQLSKKTGKIQHKFSCCGRVALCGISLRGSYENKACVKYYVSFHFFNQMPLLITKFKCKRCDSFP